MPLDIFEGHAKSPAWWNVSLIDRIRDIESGEALGFSTGFPTLDHFSRLRADELWIIAARPSVGKTALAMQMTENVASTLTADECVIIFSAEMSGTQLWARMAAVKAGVNLHKFEQGEGDPTDANLLRMASQELTELPIWIDDGGAPTTAHMLDELQTAALTSKVRLMMFDFMELGGDRGDREDLRLGQIAHNLKGIAKTLKIPVIAVSQLNREVESRATRIPGLSDLRYSGMIEQVSDVVLTIMRPEYYAERGVELPSTIPEQDREGVAYINIVKNRGGPVGKCRLAFLKERIRFAELARQGSMI